MPTLGGELFLTYFLRLSTFVLLKIMRLAISGHHLVNQQQINIHENNRGSLMQQQQMQVNQAAAENVSGNIPKKRMSTQQPIHQQIQQHQSQSHNQQQNAQLSQPGLPPHPLHHPLGVSCISCGFI